MRAYGSVHAILRSQGPNSEREVFFYFRIRSILTLRATVYATKDRIMLKNQIADWDDNVALQGCLYLRVLIMS